MKQVRFDYVRPRTYRGGVRKCTDGVLTRLDGGVHLSLWGGEQTYWFSTMGAQDGSFTAILCSSVMNSRDIPVKRWHTVHKCDTEGLREYGTYFSKVCREAALIIGKDLSEESQTAISELLLAHHEMGL